MRKLKARMALSLILTVLAVCLLSATYVADPGDQSPIARPEQADSQKPREVRLVATSPLPSVARCTTTQTEAWRQAQVAGELAVKTASAAWLKANACVPVNITQLPRPADQAVFNGTVTMPDGKVLHGRVTRHMVWNGIPGKVALTEAQRQQFQAAATTPAATLAGCCNRSTGPIYRDSWWHCSANTFTTRFYDSGENLTWSMNTFAQYCTNYVVYGGVIKDWHQRLGPVNGKPTHFSWCSAYHTGDGWHQACIAPMGQMGFYKQWPDAASKYAGFVILANQRIEWQYNPALLSTTACWFGSVGHELHFYRNHGVHWQGDIVSTRNRADCEPPLFTYHPS